MDRIPENELRCLLRTVIDAIPSVLVYVDHMGRIKLWNDKAQKVGSIEIDEARGRVVSEVLPFMKPSMKVIQRAIESGQIQSECRVTGIVNGVARVFEISVYPPVMADGDRKWGAVIRADELADGLPTGESTREAFRQVPSTTVAAQIAHELNNLLAGVLQNIQVIKQRLVGDLQKNRMLAEECGTTLEAIKAYIGKRDIIPLIEAIVDSGTRAAKAVTSELRVDRSDNVQ